MPEMSNDLLGLTIHIAPEPDVDINIREIKRIFWEGTNTVTVHPPVGFDRLSPRGDERLPNICEQFEELLLNTCHRIIFQQLVREASSVKEDDIRVEVVAAYDDASIEEWLAVGIELLRSKRNDYMSQEIVASNDVAIELCRELEIEIKLLLARSGLINQLSVEVEVTNFAGMWS